MIRKTNIILREMVLSLLGGKCMKCGSIERLEVHHKDENWKNNDKDNLRLWCKNCHTNKHGIDLRKFYGTEKRVIKKPLKAKCQYCKKEITSMYQKQLDYNLKAHELACEKQHSSKEK